ncbi:MAG: NAD(P)/FAD-dependent oxidoreductase [Nitrospirae bacterium]|nr:MAG: NAD(P)/FAD-dependent oxidoreductase [Nitrospirota bacterium]
MSQESVVIIGAGPAGLTTAYELAKRGVTSTVLEASEQVGGLARTANYRGYRFDIGGHRFFSKVPLINDLWQEILGEDFLLRPRISRIYYKQHFFDYPLKPVNALIGLGPIESFLIGLSYLKTKFFHIHNPRTFEEWVSNRFGHRLYQIFFKTYTEKVWGIPCAEISADWAAQRIKNLSLKQALRNALFGAKQAMDGQTMTSLIEQFHYPRFGPGMMWERCELLVAVCGSRILRGVKVERIRHRNGRIQCVSGRTPTGEQVDYEGTHFISTMPLRELILALDPLPPEEVVQAAQRLRYRDYLTVVLVVDRESVFPDNWLYIHSPEVKLGRIQNYKNWSPYMVPDPSRTSLGLEYFLWDKDEEWSWPEERLIDLGIRECAQLGLIDRREVKDGTVVRMEKAYPVYDQNYQESVKTVRQYLEALSNFQTIGRNGLHRYNNQDHSMLTGVYAARNIAGERHDVWAVNTEKEYHEEGRVAQLNAGDRLVPLRVAVTVGETMGEPEDEVIEAAFARLDPLALGVAVGVVSGLGIFIATAILLVRGGPVVGPMLSLLRYYVFGFEVTWTGAFVGFGEVGLWGFGLGYLSASVRNRGLKAYAQFMRWRGEAETRRNLLDKV